MSVSPLPLHRSPVSVFIAARDDRIHTALWRLLESEPGVEPTGATTDLADLIRLLGRVAADVVVLHESVLGSGGLKWLSVVARVAPQSGMVVVGMRDHPAFRERVRDAGAADYVRLDDAERLGRAVVAASERSAPLAAPIIALPPPTRD